MAEAVLLYRASCRRCRLLSGLSVVLSFGALRRVPLEGAEAQRLYECYPATRGKLALIERERCWSGARVPSAAAGVAIRCWVGRLGGLCRVLRRAGQDFPALASRRRSSAP